MIAIEGHLIELLTDSPSAQSGDLVDAIRREWPTADLALLTDTVERAMARARGFGSLEQLLAAPDVAEVMVNGPGPVWVERRGQLEATDLRLSEAEIWLVISRILDPLGLRVDRLHPMADARLADGSRVNVVVPPLAVDGPTITIRRFAATAIGLDAFGPEAVVQPLRSAVEQRKTIVISGGTGAGKTTLLNALAQSIGSDERIITIEDTAELQLGRRHLVRLEARTANAEGVGEVTIRDLVKNALRMRPDRLILGETRSLECLDLLMALTTGHRGSFTTVHANGPAGALRRLLLLASLADASVSDAAISEILAETIDYVVHIERFGARRGIAEVARIVPASPLEPTTVWRATR
ncbi:MAG: ATPase, T2SS/T4P/T4SS family [Acidimicrobiales bacterium]